jgi:hypothetical protein
VRACAIRMCEGRNSTGTKTGDFLRARNVAASRRRFSGRKTASLPWAKTLLRVLTMLRLCMSGTRTGAFRHNTRGENRRKAKNNTALMATNGSTNPGSAQAIFDAAVLNSKAISDEASARKEKQPGGLIRRKTHTAHVFIATSRENNGRQGNLTVSLMNDKRADDALFRRCEYSKGALARRKASDRLADKEIIT